MSSGMRWAETTWASKAMPNSVRMSAAWRITSQSLLEPITTPTWMAAWLEGFWVWGDVLTAGSCLVKGRILGQGPGLAPLVRPVPFHPAIFTPRSHPDRHHPRELRSRPDRRLHAAARPAGHLGALVRPVQAARPRPGKPRGRVRRPLHPGQGQRRRVPGDLRPALADVRRALQPVLRDVRGRPARRRLRGRPAGRADPRLPGQARAL